MNSQLQSFAPAAASAVDFSDQSLLDQLITEGRMAQDETQEAMAKDLVTEFVQQVLDGELVISKDLESAIMQRIAEIDSLLTGQVNEILHHQEFQKMEASWRGLQYLVFETETSTQLKIRVLNVSKKELLKDVTNAIEFDQSAIFKKVYEEEYGTFGGAPYGCLIGDFEFTNHPQDMALLEKMSGVAAAAHAPFISAASPKLFGWESFTQLGEVRDLAKIFDRIEYVKWRSFRDSEDSRYVGLCLPHNLLRLPYGTETAETETFRFEEDVTGRDHKKYLWGNAAYALGVRVTEAFAKHGWTVAIRGVEGGGLVQGMPT
ncbi:MAG TPA: type VI secretion system contractile sheath large subunit, partial [Acidobacteriota bacterium]|nr:type VI secretion system contractile sheath large subunit [Acidobacteriota bacterium]